ncbi:MAG: VOC family protein [Rhodospirillaceae bacterium]
MTAARLNYLELPVADPARAKAFYSAALGLEFTDFGPTYAATTTGDTDIGFQADTAQKTAAPLPVIEVENLEVALKAVKAAGGKITQDIFAFPGGRRFHFRDPDGHELGVVKTDPHGAG